MYKVLHYLTPEEIEMGLKKAFKWLSPGGKLFIDVVTPFHSGFGVKASEIYEKRWKEGDLWPGSDFKTSNLSVEYAAILPETIHLLDSRPLFRVLKPLNFIIEQAAFSKIKEMQVTENKPTGQEGFGIIVRKLRK